MLICAAIHPTVSLPMAPMADGESAPVAGAMSGSHSVPFGWQARILMPGFARLARRIGYGDAYGDAAA